jgi:hypothetical protein
MRSPAFVRLVAILLAGASACGGAGASQKASNVAASSSPDARGAFTAYTDCLRAHGVAIPTLAPGQTPGFGRRFGGRQGPQPSRAPGAQRAPGGQAGGRFGQFNDPKFQEAQKACQSKLPQGGQRSARFGQAFQAYRSCMKDHGIVLPDAVRPNPSAAPINTADPTFKAANDICKALLPTPGPGQGQSRPGSSPPPPLGATPAVKT